MEDITPHDQATRGWVLLLAVICAGIVAYGYLYAANTTSDIAFLFGYNLPIGLVIWAVFHVAIGRKHGTKKAGISFLLILVSLISGNLVSYSRQKSEAVHAVTEIQKSYSSITNAAKDVRGLPQRIEINVDTAPTARGEFGEIERFTKTFMNRIGSQRNDYLLELDAVGWNTILDLDRIKQDETFVESRMMIRRAYDIVSKYRAKTFILLDNARKEIGDLNLSNNRKNDMFSGFDSGMKEARSQIEYMWELEKMTISEVENIIALLSARNGEWTVQDGHVLFADQLDLDAFNSYNSAIQENETRRQTIEKLGIAKVNNNLSKLLE